jgi:hypothetical protein
VNSLIAAIDMLPQGVIVTLIGAGLLIVGYFELNGL